MTIIITIMITIFCLSLAIIFYFMLSFIFHSKITEHKVLQDTDYIIATPDIEVKEIFRAKAPYFYPCAENYGQMSPVSDLAFSEKILITPTNQIIRDESRIFDDDPARDALMLELPNGEILIFIKQQLYQSDGKRIGSLMHSFTGSALGEVKYVNVINQTTLILTASASEPDSYETLLFQFDLTNFSLIAILKQANFCPANTRHPAKTITPAGFDGVLFVGYCGNRSYAFGGDSSRPKQSVLRLYSKFYPLGIELIQLSLNAGIIVEVTFADGILTIIGDPSRPTQIDNYQRDARYWQLDISSVL